MIGTKLVTGQHYQLTLGRRIHVGSTHTDVITGMVYWHNTVSGSISMSLAQGRLYIDAADVIAVLHKTI